ncbi:chemotaxis protein CheA [Tabrizicola sp.]|uniref:chemotaxis protein CheA n=1 Tax=Tabrizicola sp. TaxID=2005166 RepID=UPI0035B3B442
MAGQDSFRDLFFEEAEDLLGTVSDEVARLKAGERDNEIVHSIFRAVHSIKGSAGAFSLDRLVGFAHRFETVLDAVRSDQLPLTAELLHIVERSVDHLSVLVEASRNDLPVDPALTEAALAALDTCLEPGPAKAPAPADPAPPAAETPEAEPPFAFAALALDLDAFSDPQPLQTFTIRFRPHAALYDNGHEPALLIGTLAQLGTLQTRLDLSALPDWSSPDILEPAFDWLFRLETTAGRGAVEAVFEFVDGLCDLAIVDARDGDLPPAAAPAPTSAETPLPPASSEALADGPVVTPVAAVGQPAAATADGGPPRPTLRVDLDRIERLFNAVGELIINQSMIAQRVDDLQLHQDADMMAHVESYRLLARDIQEAVMAIRAQPVKPLFQRMSRIVREAAEGTGKQAQLVMLGEATEIDKTVVERLADPLTHMVRNSVDHGLEAPDRRRAVGKDPVGTIWLSAAHRSGSVVITIRDDGAGLDREKVLRVAVAKGLVPAGAELSESEIDNLIFLPGFSTASSTSLLSGRGVGLDVVRNAVQALGGRVGISSRPGKGTEFTISLPLTLAVLDGMLISVGRTSVIVPIAAVLETIRPLPGDVQQIGSDERLLSIRGRFVPIIDLAETLGFPRSEPDGSPMLLLLVETEARGTCALLVDHVHDQRQVVIKGLEGNYGQVAGVSAATVLGDGQIALILDPDGIVAQAQVAIPPTGGPRVAALT